MWIGLLVFMLSVMVLLVDSMNELFVIMFGVMLMWKLLSDVFDMSDLGVLFCVLGILIVIGMMMFLCIVCRLLMWYLSMGFVLKMLM